MGSVNYRTSDFITLAIKPYDADDLLNDADYKEWLNENNLIDEEEKRQSAYTTIDGYYDCDKENFEAIMKNYQFRFFNISLLNGYYEGLSIDINFDYEFYDYKEKQEAQKEVTQLKKCLNELNGVGFQACSPFWVTTYYNYPDTKKRINKAIKEMRQTVKNANYIWR